MGWGQSLLGMLLGGLGGLGAWQGIHTGALLLAEVPLLHL